MNLTKLVTSLNNFFDVDSVDIDPQMELFLPRTYNSIGYDWKNSFEEYFTKHLNGLMIKGAESVNKVYLCSFPSPDVIDIFLETATKGDLLFSHHPIYMECGDPKGTKGRGWLPVEPSKWEEFKQRGLSYYSCHSPLDYHLQVGTRASMLRELNATYIADFFSDGVGPHGAIAAISPTKLKDLLPEIKSTYGVDYLDLDGDLNPNKLISKVAVVAGGGDNVEHMKTAEKNEVDLYLTGEFNSRFSTEWAEENQLLIDSFNKKTKMSMIGVSHSACEYLTMKSQLPLFFKGKYNLRTVLLPQSEWWR